MQSRAAHLYAFILLECLRVRELPEPWTPKRFADLGAFALVKALQGSTPERQFRSAVSEPVFGWETEGFSSALTGDGSAHSSIAIAVGSASGFLETLSDGIPAQIP